MSERRQLISESIGRRFREVCDRRISSLSPDDFGAHSSFVTRVQQQFSDATTTTFQWQLKPFQTWQQSNLSGSIALQALSFNELIVTPGTEPPHVDEFLGNLKSARKNASHSLELLMTRYACPVNFSCSGESGVRESVLEGLMVRDRKRIEEGSLASSDTDHLWYRLNLLAGHSRVSHDLRFLDALNYYFEYIPDNWQSRAENNWLFVSYLALYALALAAKCEELRCG